MKWYSVSKKFLDFVAKDKKHRFNEEAPRASTFSLAKQREHGDLPQIQSTRYQVVTGYLFEHSYWRAFQYLGPPNYSVESLRSPLYSSNRRMYSSLDRLSPSR